MSAFFEDDDQQPTFNDDSVTEGEAETDAPEEGESGNRLFLYAAIGIGVVILLTIIGAVIFFVSRGSGSVSTAALAEQTAAAEATVARGVEMTAAVLNATPTLPPTATFTPVPSSTPLMVTEVVETPGAVETATVAALNTQMALSQAGGAGAGTAVAGAGSGTAQPAATQAGGASSSTQASAAATSPSAGLTAAAKTGTPNPTMPNSGIADEMGLPGLFVAALVMVAIIFLARRLRSAPMAR